MELTPSAEVNTANPDLLVITHKQLPVRTREEMNVWHVQDGLDQEGECEAVMMIWT